MFTIGNENLSISKTKWSNHK